MSELKIFENETFGQVRTLSIDNEPWFVGKDVAEALGYAKPENALAAHVEDVDKTTTLIQGDGSNYKSKTTIINESGLYALIFGSKLDNAKEFKHWVTSEVLPSIRKTGSYIAPTQAVPNLDNLSGLARIMRAVDIPMAAQKHRADARAKQAKLLMDAYGIPCIPDYIKAESQESAQLTLDVAPAINISHVENLTLESANG